MKTSPLQLDSYFILKTEVCFNEDKVTDTNSQDVNIQVSVGRGAHEENPRRWKVDLTVVVKDTAELPSPYSIDVTLRGYFTVEDAYPLEKVEMLVAANAPAVLYGSVREIVSLLTGRGPSVAIVLPSITFVDDAQKLKQKAEHLSQDRENLEKHSD